MHRIKRHFLNALLEEAIQRRTMQDKCSPLQTLQTCTAIFSCWNFCVSGFGVSEVYVLAKDLSCEKRREKIIIPQKLVCHHGLFSLCQYKQVHRILVLFMRKLRIPTIPECIFLIFIHFWNVSMENKTFVVISSPRNNFSSWTLLEILHAFET